MLSSEKSQRMAPTTAMYASPRIFPIALSPRLIFQTQVGWIATIALMTKTQIGLGVLSIPATFDALGVIPGVICLVVISAITTWSDYMIGIFKKRHPEVYGLDDAGFMMFGKIGREVFALIFMFCEYLLVIHCKEISLMISDWIFVSGSAMLGISIGLNAVSTHAACTAVFVAVAAVATFGFASIRTLGKIGWLAWIGLVCIMTASELSQLASNIERFPNG